MRQLLATLVGHYTFDETSGGVAADSISGNNGIWQNGTSANLTWSSSGQIGGAATLADTGGAAADNYFQISSLNQLNGVAGLSISMWVDPNTQSSSGYNGIFMTRNFNGQTNNSWGLAIENNGNERLDSRVDGPGFDSADGVLSPAAGWVHIGLVWDGTAKTHKQYVNGVLTRTDDVSGDANLSSTIAGASNGPWYIGYDDCCGDNRDFDGSVDDLAVFSDVVTDAEMMDIYNGGLLNLNIQQVLGAPQLESVLRQSPMSRTTNAANVTFRVAFSEDVQNFDPADLEATGSATAGVSIDSVTAVGGNDALYDVVVSGIDTSTSGTLGLSIVGSHNIEDVFGNPLITTTPTGSAEEFNIQGNGLQSIIGHWAFDESAGTTASDSINGNDGEDIPAGNAPTWVAGQIGNAANLDGTTNFIVNEITQLDGTSSFTIAGWFNAPNAQSTGYEGVFVTRTFDEAGLDADQNYGFSWEGNSTARHIDARSSGAAFDSPDAAGSTWRHVIQTFDFAADISNVYIDGTFAGSIAIPAAATGVADSGSWLFGDDSCCGGREIDASLDDFAMFNNIVDPAEIAAVHGLGLFSNIAVTDTKIQDILAMTTAGQTVANVGPNAHTWEYVSGLTGPVGTTGGTVAAGTAFIVLDSSGNGLQIVVDLTPPVLQSLTPADDSVDVAFNTNLELTFDTNVQKGTGNVTIHLASDDSVVETIDINGSNVSINGTTVTIDPANDLLQSTAYYVQVPGSAIEDTAANAFAGITGTSAWNFTTADPLASLIGHWPFDEAAGTTAFDTVNGNDALDVAGGSSPTWSAGLIGNAATLDGGTNFIVNEVTQIDGVTAFTIAGWFNVPNAQDTGYEGIYVTRTLDEVGANTDRNYGFSSEGNSTARHVDARASNAAFDSVDVPGSAWHHVVQTFDFGAHVSRVYIDGEFAGTVAIPPAATGVSDSGSWLFGDDSCCGNREIAGSLDDFAMFDNTISVAEIAAIHGLGRFSQVAVDSPKIVEALGLDTPAQTVTGVGPDGHTWEYVSGLAGGAGVTGGSVAGNDAFIVLDASGNGIRIVPDTTPPVVQTLVPADDSTAVSISTDLALTFDSNVQAGTGSVTIRLASDDTVVDTIDITGGNVTFSGPTVNINPTNNLAKGTEYYVEIPGSAITDAAGNAFAGVAGTTAWNFTTADHLASIIGHWTFDEASGVIAADSINGNNGIDVAGGSSPTWGTGIIGNAASLDGGTNFIVNEITQLDSVAEFAIAGWFNAPNAQSTGYEGVFVTRTLDEAGLDADQNYGFSSEGNNTARHIDARASGLAFDSPDVPGSTWHHVVQTFDFAASISNVYINGEFAGSITIPAAATGVADSGSWLFGDDSCCGGREINATLDDFAMFSSVVDPNEVAAVHGLGRFSGVNINDAKIKDILKLDTVGQSVTDVGPTGHKWDYVAGLVGDVGATGGSVATADAYIVLDASGNGIQIDLDIVPPTVDSITAPAMTYVENDTILFTVAFSENVTLSGAGDSSILLDLGGTMVTATHVGSVSGTNLTYAYTVVSGQEDADGVEVVADSLQLLSGATLQDDAGNDATLTHGGAALSNVLVDAVRPTVVSITGSAVPTVHIVGDTLAVSVELSESVTLSAAGDAQLIADIGGTNVTLTHAGSVAGATLTFSSVLPTGLNDSDGVDVTANTLQLLNGATLRDAAGNDAILVPSLANLANDQVDTAAPMISTLSPSDDAVSVAVNAQLIITFDQTIQAGSGDIRIGDDSNAATFETFPIGSVGISGSVLTITPTTNFNGGTDYHVEVDASAILDSSGNSFSGIADAATWNFTTVEPNLAPTVDDQTFSVNENSGVGTSVGTIAATDQNTGDPLAFTVTS